MSNASATLASTEKRVLVGLGVTGQSVARWWQRQGIGFTAIDTRAELADDPAVFAHVDPQTTAFGDIDSAMLDGCTDMIVSSRSCRCTHQASRCRCRRTQWFAGPHGQKPQGHLPTRHACR